MRTFLLAAVLALVAVTCAPVARGDTVQVTTTNVFYTQLAPYGDWIQLSPYNYVWVPRAVPYGWRPYTNGYWIYTTAYGWTWVSNFSWGWGPFHYGRWLYDANYGWVWIPGTVWSPAWVSWRVGVNYIGWAPLSPAIVWSAPGILYTHIDIDSNIYWIGWTFVPCRDFDRRDLTRFTILPARNLTLLNETHNVTRLRLERGRVVNQSLSPDDIRRLTGRHIIQFNVRDQKAPKPSAIRGSEVDFYRPTIRSDTTRTVPPPQMRPPVRQAPRTYRTQTPSMDDLRRQQDLARQRLNQIQSNERKSPPLGVTQNQLLQRQQREQRAQQQEQQLETRQFNFNRDRVRPTPQATTPRAPLIQQQQPQQRQPQQQRPRQQQPQQQRQPRPRGR